MTAQELAHLGAELALSKKAKDVTILDLRGLSDISDYFVICTGESDTQVKAISDTIIDGVKEAGQKVNRKEGFQNLQWVLLDMFDVVFHVFLPQVREYYNLERLWGDAPVEVVEDSLGS